MLRSPRPADGCPLDGRGKPGIPDGAGTTGHNPWARKRRGTGSAKVAEPDLDGSRVVGELAVHRESLSRGLRENPESLVGILEALVSALTGHQRPVDAEREEEETESYALTEV